MTRTDPVCKMKVDDEAAPAYVEYEGRDYFFCSEECKNRFLETPERYLEAA